VTVKQNDSSRGLGRRIHGSVEDTKLSTNKQHSLSVIPTGAIGNIGNTGPGWRLGSGVWVEPIGVGRLGKRVSGSASRSYGLERVVAAGDAMGLISNLK
jgi:hypothetical protein